MEEMKCFLHEETQETQNEMTFGRNVMGMACEVMSKVDITALKES